MTPSSASRPSRPVNRWRLPPVELTSNYRALDRALPQPGRNTPILWPPCLKRWQDSPRRQAR